MLELRKLTKHERRYLSNRFGLTANERTNFLQKIIENFPRQEAASIREALNEVDAEIQKRIEDSNEVSIN